MAIMQRKIKILLGTIIAFQILLEISCDVTRRKCYSCDGIENCKQDKETMKVETCKTSTDADHSENYCVEEEDPENGSVFSRGCAAKVVEIDGEHQFGLYTTYRRFETEYQVNRFCICKQNKCNFNRCGNPGNNIKPQKQFENGTTSWTVVGCIFLGFFIGAVISSVAVCKFIQWRK